MDKIRTAVIGVGSLGQHHARILTQHPNSNLIAVSDLDEKKGDKISRLHNTSYLKDYKALVGKIDAAVISVPTPFHFEVSKYLLDNGIHCLVEKPFTSTVAEAQELISIAMNANLVLQVGHIERFNPAVIAAIPYVTNPKFIEVNRLGPYDPRTSHIGVVLDLMIHDLDILLALVKDRVVSLEAYGAKVLSEHEDIVKVRLKFERGCVADVSASRVSLEKYRKIRIFMPDTYISVDYAGKSLKIYRKKTPVVKSLGDIEVIKPKLKDEEMLYKELDHFLSCVREGKKTSVPGEHGRDALELAHEILKNIQF
jgi:predicted dehydrogenase